MVRVYIISIGLQSESSSNSKREMEVEIKTNLKLDCIAHEYNAAASPATTNIPLTLVYIVKVYIEDVLYIRTCNIRSSTHIVELL